MKLKALSSSSTTRDRTRTSARQAKPTEHGPASAPEIAMDANALRALAWLQRGKPEDEIVYDDDAPKQTEAELLLLEPSSYVREKPKMKP